MTYKRYIASLAIASTIFASIALGNHASDTQHTTDSVTASTVYWTEPNVEMPEGYELMSGSPALMPPTATIVEEDSPLWDCHTMGNRVCGAGRG